MSAEPHGPTTEELRARVFARELYDRRYPTGLAPRERKGDPPPAVILLERPCLACNREPGERMCDLCQRLEVAEASVRAD